MATHYLDYEGGSDSNSGDSFAVTATGTDGAIATATFTSASASFNSGYVGRYIYVVTKGLYSITGYTNATTLTIAAISGGTALSNGSGLTYNVGGRVKTFATGLAAARIITGDTIRIMASPEPTSLGQNGTWTTMNRTLYMTGKSVSSSTNATPISITITAHGYATGDVIRIINHTVNTNANGVWIITSTGANTFTLDGSIGKGVGGATGTAYWSTNHYVKLTTAVTQLIDDCEVNWTASANVTCALNSASGKSGLYSVGCAVAAAFTTGLAAYKATGTLDLSGYKQVSFWFYSSVTFAASQVSLRLCSDTAGVTTVHTCTIPAYPAVGWVPLTFDFGAALSSSIQSVALYMDADFGATTIYFDNITASKDSTLDDSLTLTSLIGKNNGSEFWWCVGSINGLLVGLDASPNLTNVTSAQSVGFSGYSGKTESVTLYKRETVKFPMTTGFGVINQTTEAGFAVFSTFNYSGGWDRTNMSTQSGETWWDAQSGNGYLIYAANAFSNFDRIFAARAYYGLNIPNVQSCTLGTIGAVGCTNGVFLNGNCGRSKVAKMSSTGGVTGVYITGSGGFGCTFDEIYAVGAQNPVILVGYEAVVKKLTALCGAYTACSAGGSGNVVQGGTIGYAVQASLGGGAGNFFCKDVIFLDPTPVQNLYSGNTGMVSVNHNMGGGTSIYKQGGTITTNTSVRHTASGVSWAMSLTSSTYYDSVFPFEHVIGTIACSANVARSVSVWMYRTNTGTTGRLAVKGGFLAGVPSDVTATTSGSASTWEQLTINFTPTEAGVIEIWAQQYNGTTYTLYVDDLSWT